MSSRKYLTVVSIALLISCKSAHKLEKTWQYTHVLKNNNLVFEISANDTMVLNKDKTFRYDISKPNKHSAGIWYYDHDTLFLTYNLDNTLRKFKVEKLTRKNLVLKENEITFKYKRR